MSEDIKCQQCGSEMKKTKKVNRDMAMQVVGVLVFLFGLCLLFFFPIGTIAGLVLMVAAGRLGYSKKKVWLCGNCGYFFERA